MPWLMMLSLACVLDRTGQSASNQMQREIRDNGVRVYNVEQQFLQVEARVNQLENLVRATKSQEAVGLESLDGLRSEVGRLRGEMELLTHSSSQGEKDIVGQVGDARFRVLWLESRADQLERSLGLSTPPPPAMAPTETEAEGASNWDGPAGEATTSPEPASPAAPESAAATPEAEPIVDSSPAVVMIEVPDSAPSDAGTSEPAPDPVSTPTLDPMTLLDNAKAQLKEGNLVGAETMLGRFLELHPNHSRADEATYRRAEASMKAENYEQAVLRFQEVIDQFKGSTFAPWAMFKQGECFEAQEQAANAQVFYGEVVRIYPKSRAAKAARKKLGR